MTKGSDRELVERARAGDSRAFGEFVRRHQERILRLALHLVRSRVDAEDVAQEAFVRAYRALDRFDGRSEPYTWLYRIAVNLSLNVLRARRAKSGSDHHDDARLDSLSIDASAGDDAAGKQTYRALCEGLDALSETLRTTLILVCVDGLSHEEAAAVLGAPEGTIAWRVHEARKKLREHLAKAGFPLEEQEG